MSDLIAKANEFKPMLKGDKDILTKKPNLLPKWGKASAIGRKVFQDGSEWNGDAWIFFRSIGQIHAKEWKRGSLLVLSHTLNVTTKTIRRYCEAGLLAPYARRSTRGHWRIDYRRITKPAYNQLRKRWRRVMRLTARVSKVNRREQRKIDRENKAVWLAHSTHLASGECDGYLFPEESASDDPIPEKWLQSVAGNRGKLTALLIAVRQLYREQISVSATKGMGKIAQRLGISRSSLYRHYTPAEMKFAISMVYG